MADKSISELAVAQQMTDDAKLVVYQDGGTKSIEGQLIKGYAKDAVTQYVEGAKTSAQEAAQSAAAAQTAREGVETHEEQAAASATAAAGSADAAQEARTGAETARAGAEDQAKVSQSYAVGGTGLSHGSQWVKIDEVEINKANVTVSGLQTATGVLEVGATYRVTVNGVPYECVAQWDPPPPPTPGGDIAIGGNPTYLDAGPVHVEESAPMGLERYIDYQSTQAPVRVVLYKRGGDGEISDDVDNAKYYKELAERAQVEVRSSETAVVGYAAGAAADKAAAEVAKTTAEAAKNAAAESALEAEASATEAAESARSAEQYSGKPPIIRDGTWWMWHAEQQAYVDTGSPAQGNLMYATFFVDPATGELYMETPDDYKGPSFALVDGRLEVTV